MQQHQMPLAPPPPPTMRPGFPGVPGLADDFGRVHLDPHAHRFEHMQQPNYHVIQPPDFGHLPDLRMPSNGKPPIGYVGYIFTKHPAEHVGQRETWAIADKELMPASQADLKIQVEKHRKRGVTGLEQYNDSDMKGFKRKQIDELIRHCMSMDSDHRFEYTIASIKRDTKRRQSGPSTSTMQVILKRQARAGVIIQGPFMGIGDVRLPLGGMVDLSGADDSEKWSQNSSNGHKPGAFPFERHLSEPWVRIDHSDARPQLQHAHSHEHADHHDLGHAHAHGEHHHGHADSGIHNVHDLEQGPHPHFRVDVHDDKHGHEEKGKKHEKKEHKTPKVEIFHTKQHKSHKSHSRHSDSSSISDSDSSSGDTDRTPDTIISSEGLHYHHKDKKYHKSKNYRKSGSHEREHEPVRVVYREHKRKEATRRASSPPPRRSYYPHEDIYHREDVYLEPGFTSRRRPESRYPNERPHDHHRAMSYDEGHLHDRDMGGLARRPTMYRRRITSSAYPMDAHDVRAERRRHEMLDREIWEKEERMRLRREAARDSERMFRAARPRMDPRIHDDHHDDHLHDYYYD